MKRSLLALAAMAFAARLGAAEPAEIALYLFDADAPLAGAEVRVDGSRRGLTNADGVAHLSLEAGSRRLVLMREGSEVAAVDLSLQPDEDVQLIVTLQAAGLPRVLFESSHAGSAAPASEAAADPIAAPGTFSGTVVGSEDGRPLAAARLYVAGTPLDIVTDADGRFSVPVAAGRYSVSVLAPGHSPQTLYDVVVTADETTERRIELVPAGLELPDFVVLEPFVEGSLAAFAEERRANAAVTDILGAEQISRAGDSDAAGALKRVTGLTLVGGKYVYVRGLGERYSSILLNGAQVPSPDPTRRVVPLDLFPTDILQGVVVQKTYSADMPGEFGGGTIQLRTRGMPEAPFLKLSLGLGGAQGSTFDEGLDYAGGGRDWSGRDDGSRALPDTLDAIRQSGRVLRARSPANPQGLSPAEIETAGESIAGGYDVVGKRVGPDLSLAAAGGSRWQFGDDWQFGALASLRYSRNHDNRDETRRYFVATSQGLSLRDETALRSSTTGIDGSLFLVAGLEFRDTHAVRATSMLLRQTEDEVRRTDGMVDNQQLERYSLEWIENSLLAHQLGGEHTLPWWIDGGRFDWQATDGRARRDAPDTRDYRFNITPDGLRELSQFGESNTQTWSDLVDDSRAYDFNLTLPYRAGDWLAGSLGLHGGRLDRQRDSYIRRYQFAFRFPNQAARDAVIRLPTLDRMLTPANIGPNGFVLTETTQPTDNYVAEGELAYRGITLDAALFERWRLNLGLREEDNRQAVTTFSVIRPGERELGLIDQTDRLPSAALTWTLSDRQQLRAGYSRTVSRPDFRELSAAPYVDPVLDFITFGNPELETATIRNLDLRWEYYFSPTESLSIAAFRKDFTRPIEKQLLPGSGSILLTLANAEGAVNQGVEFDLFKQLGFLDRPLAHWRLSRWLRLDRISWDDWFVSANYAWIDSQIRLDPARSGFNTNLERPLEGQSPYVFNLQLGYADAERRREATLLYNIVGERIVQVGVDGQPDTYEQPFGQLDFNVKQKLGQQWSLRLRVRNLLDPNVEFRQGNGVLREYRRGREIGLSVEWTPF